MTEAPRLWPLSRSKPSEEKKCEESGRLRILILMSDTGGGHRASAQALQAGFEELFGDKYEVRQ